MEESLLESLNQEGGDWALVLREVAMLSGHAAVQAGGRLHTGV